ncbi:prepilin peptidase [Pusillimonas caeni]|uniref:prepilin peptidase n=1 Tax=Pusillimonas caeni TaxID=1348472 RepID=UPI000E59ADCC|nr:A24 family peptidase [Pusillimonas caeni]TFL14031.1 prepilin peptidase [Pusillimonas caeni]
MGIPWLTLASILLVTALILLSWVDIRTGLLPDSLTLPLGWLGLIVNLDGMLTPLREAVLGAVFGYLILWSANLTYRRIKGIDGMGYGDFKLIAALGAWFGIAMLPWIIIGACIAGCGMVAAHRAAGRAPGPMPFGPCISVAGITALAFVFSR